MRSSARLPSDRSQPHQRFDRAPLVLGGVRFRDAVEVGLEVEDAAGLDATRQDVVEELRDVGAHGRTAAAQPDVAGEHSVDRNLDAVGNPDDPTVAPGRATVNAVANDWAVPTHSRAASTPTPSVSSRTASVAASPRSATMSLAPNDRASAWRGGFRVRAMTRAAPRRPAAMTAHRPTAPSPTTATTLPETTPALSAAWWPVGMTSESAITEAIVSSE